MVSEPSWVKSTRPVTGSAVATPLVCPVIVTEVTSIVPSASVSLANTFKPVSVPPSATGVLVKSSLTTTGASFTGVTAKLTVASLLGAPRLSFTV